MPLRPDIRSVVVIGSGPIVIGQACEFDYSGTQACRVLRAEGIRVILVNSNPATIMTDPDMADATYVEPITTEVLAAVIAKERPDALLPTLGGQTALNAAMGLVEAGVLERYDVELIGASAGAINAGEDRDEFKSVVERCGAEVARSIIARTMVECHEAVESLGGYPVVVRPSFTMGGLGSGIAFDEEDLTRICGQGLAASRTTAKASGKIVSSVTFFFVRRFFSASVCACSSLSDSFSYFSDRPLITSTCFCSRFKIFFCGSPKILLSAFCCVIAINSKLPHFQAFSKTVYNYTVQGWKIKGVN